MLPLDSSDDDNILVHLVEMDTCSLDYTLSSCSDDVNFCLAIDFSLNLDHEFNVAKVVLEYSCDCLPIFVSTFGQFVDEVNNICCYDHSI